MELHLTYGMADSLEAWAPRFDDKINLLEAKLTYGLLSRSEGGIQTAETFREFLKWLSEQVKERSKLKVRDARGTALSRMCMHVRLSR